MKVGRKPMVEPDAVGSELGAGLGENTLETWLGFSTCVIPEDAIGTAGEKGMAWTIHLPAGTGVVCDLTPENYGSITFTRPKR